MAIVLALPVLGLMVILQSAILSRVNLLYGSVDLVLLVVVAWAVQERVKTAWHWGIIAGLLVSLVTSVPIWAILPAYVGAAGIAIFMRRIFWQRPVLAMVAAIFLTTLFTQVMTVLALGISGITIPLTETFYLVTIPSVLLNLLLAIPVYALIGDLANWLYPETLEI
jgi:rod shape-determining protein MreD